MEKAQVWVEVNEGSKLDGRYLVQELDPIEEVPRIFDQVAKKYQDIAGEREIAARAAQELFCRRVVDWEIKANLPCNEENKKLLFRKKTAFANRILQKADNLLEEEAEKELGN